MEYTDGSMKFKVRRFGDDGGGGLLPGAIIAFSGSFSDDGYPLNKGRPDKDWHLCDGTNGTPDLRGRFILGASGAHAKGTTGGEEETGLSIANLPPHSFSGTTSTDGNHNHVVYGTDNDSGPDGIDTEGNSYHDRQHAYPTTYAGAHYHTFTTNTLGEGTPHNNMPPFYALSYIMKL